MMEETGSDEFWATFNVSLGAEIIRDVAGRISNIGGLAPITNEMGRSAIVWKEPYGVIMGIAPWYVFTPAENHLPFLTTT